jgi:hypothetical protein
MGIAKTPIGNTVSYLPVGEFLKRCDQRTVAQLCNDKDKKQTAPLEQLIAELPANENLMAGLLDASGYFESAVLTSERYSLADLQALPSGSPGQALMYAILSDITTGCLFKRRPSYPQDPKALEACFGWLNRLQAGNVIFPFKQTAEAGLLTAERDTTLDVDRRDGLSVITKRLMGRRTNRWHRW